MKQSKFYTRNGSQFRLGDLLKGFIVLGLIIGINSWSLAQQGPYLKWESHTNGREVNDFAENSGNLWIATRGGLVKLDKKTGSKKFFNSSNSELPGNDIIAVHEDNGTIIIGTYNNGVVTYDNGKWTIYNKNNSQLETNTISCLGMGQSDVLVGTLGEGVFQLDVGLGQISDPNYTIGTNIYAIENGGFEIWFGTSDGLVERDWFYSTTTTYNTFGTPLQSDIIMDVEVVGNNKWAATRKGLAKYDGSSWTIYDKANSKIPDNDVNAIAIDGSEKWVGTFGGGLAKLSNGNWTTYKSSTSKLNSNTIDAVFFDNADSLWVGTEDNNLNKRIGNKWQSIKTTNSKLPDNTVEDIAIDSSSGTKWVATFGGGVGKFSGSQWTNFSPSNSGLPDNQVTSVDIAKSGNKWFGTWGSGIVKFNGNSWTTFNKSNSGIHKDSIIDIKSDGLGNVWVATNDTGLAKYNGSSWTIYTASNSGLPSNSMTLQSLAVDNANNIWIGTFGGGVAKYNGNTWKTYNRTNSNLLQNFITGLSSDSKGNIWGGTFNRGFNYFDGVVWTSYFGSKYPDAVRSIGIGRNSYKWLGSANGEMFKYKNNQTTIFDDSTSGMPGNSYLYSISVEKNGKVWIGTDQGLIEYNKNFVNVCLPRNLKATAARADSVQLTWDSATKPNTQHQIQYGKQNFKLGNGTIIPGIQGDDYYVSGLKTTKTYDFYVRAVCGNADTSKWIGPYTVYPSSINNVRKNVPDDGCGSGNKQVIPMRVTGVNGDSLGTDSRLNKVHFETNRGLYGFASAGDLHISLKAPNGREIDLATNRGDGFYDVNFQMRNAESLSQIQAFGDVQGNYKPEDAFKKLYNNGNPNGLWKIVICDDTTGDKVDFTGATLDLTIAQPNSLRATESISDSVRIAWKPGINADEYQIQYGAKGFIPGRGTITNLFGIKDTSEFVTLNFTQPPWNAYDLYVRGINKPGDTSSWAGPYSIFPEIYEGYGTKQCDASIAVDLTTCSNGRTAVFPMVVKNVDGNSLGQDVVVDEFSLVANTSREYNITLESPNGKSVKIASDSIDVGSLGSIGCDPVDFTMNSSYNVFNRRVSPSGSFQPIESFNKLYDNSDPNGLWKVKVCGDVPSIDHFALNLTTCQAPNQLEVLKGKGDSVKVGWQTGKLSANKFEIQYGKSGFVPGRGSFIQNIQDTTTYISGLVEGQAYDVYVRSVCGPSKGSEWRGPLTINNLSTSCPLEKPIINQGCQNNNNTTVPLRFSDYSNPSLGSDLKLSEVNVIVSHETPSELRLSLKSPNGVEVKLSTNNDVDGFSDNYGDPLSCQQGVASFNMSATTPITSDPSSFTGSFIPEGDFSDFHKGNNPNGIWELVVCDTGLRQKGAIQYVELNFETCKPDHLEAYEANGDSVSLQWEPGELVTKNYLVQYGSKGFNLNNGTIKGNIQDTTTTISGLQPHQSYDFYVSSICSSGDTSSWIGPYTLHADSTKCDLDLNLSANTCNSGDSLVMPIGVLEAPGNALGNNAALANVNVLIDQPEVGDLSLRLQSPAGKQIKLSDFNGGFSDNFGDTSNCPYSAFSFSKDAFNRIDEIDPPFKGMARPEESFSSLYDGSDPKGIWKLIVCNNGSDKGSIKHVELEFYNPLLCNPGPTADAGNDTAINYGDTLILRGRGGNDFLWSNGSRDSTIQFIADSSQTQRFVLKAFGDNNCTDKDQVKITVNPRPTLDMVTFLGDTTDKGVNPKKGTIKQTYEYRIRYTHPNNVPPKDGFPRLGIDYNGDGDFTDGQDSRIFMSELDPSDQNYKDGKLYTFVRGFKKPNKDLQFSFIAYDTLGSPAKGEGLAIQKGPKVARDSLDLHLFANDIQFSESNPDPKDSVKISATIHNKSIFSASSVDVNFYIQDSLLTQKTLPNVFANSSRTVSIHHNFSKAGFYPVKVVIDPKNEIKESNELNNSAIRPLTVGNYTTTGGISINSILRPDSACKNENLIFKGSAFYKGMSGNQNQAVKGAEVKVKIRETGELFKGNTDNKGFFRVPISAPDSLGTFKVRATVTDFTLSKQTNLVSFNTRNCPKDSTTLSGGSKPKHWKCENNCGAKGGGSGGKTVNYPDLKPDLVVESQFISPSKINPDVGEKVNVVSSVKNKGNVSADSFRVRFYGSGSLLGNKVMIPLLGAGNLTTVQATDSFSSSQNGAHVLRVKADTPDQVVEKSESNNDATRALIVGDALDFGISKLTISPVSPTIGINSDITAKVINYGGRNGSGKLKFYTIDGSDTTAFDSSNISINKQDTTTVSINWSVTQITGSLYAEVSNINPQDAYKGNNSEVTALAGQSPLVLQQPANKTVCVGESISLTVKGRYETGYQWLQNGSVIAGAQDSSLTISPVELKDSGTYRCVLENGAGKDSSVQVNVEVQPLAKAAYSYQLNQKTADFSSNATHYDSLLWKFGDGKTDSIPNPSHTYSSEGLYEVCFIAFNSCNVDTICKNLNIGDVTVPDTIKGSVTFAGDPLDQGKVSLWRVGSSDYTKVDSISLSPINDGQFNFGGVPSGEYLIKAMPGENTNAYEGGVPTYHGDEGFWESAREVETLDSGKVRRAEVSLIQAEKDTGSGSIAGKITEADLGKRPGAGDPLEKVEVLLMDKTGDFLDFRVSDLDGNYRFPNLPFDTFQLTVEITGVQAPNKTVILSKDKANFDSVNFKVDKDKDSVVVGRRNPEAAIPNRDFTVFPNPAEEAINTVMKIKEKQDVTLTITNVKGQQVFEDTRMAMPGINKFTLSADDLRPGVYILKMKGVKMMKTARIVIK